MMGNRSRNTSLMLASLGVALLPRCSCEEGTIERAAVDMSLTFIETDSCSGAQVPRRIPDDYERTGQAASTDFGSRGERTFEIRSVGSAPLSVSEVRLEPEDSEFTITLLNNQDAPAMLPVNIPASVDPETPPGLKIRIEYASQDNEPDLVNLVVKSDDRDRGEVRFALSAGRGRVEVCTEAGCMPDGVVDFGNVPLGSEAEQTVTIRNTGEGDLDLRSIRLAGSSGEFCAREATEIPEGVEDCSLVQQCLVLRPGETYTVTVRFRPVDGGCEDPASNTLTIVSGDAQASSVSLGIRGCGAGPAICACVVDGADCTPVQVVDFGAVGVGASEDRTVRLVSCGTDAVEISEATLETMMGNPFFTGPDFQIRSAFNLGVFQPNEYSEGSITYLPTGPGIHRGGLRYQIASTQLRSWIGLVGQAATCDLEAVPQMVNFGTVAGGASGDRIVTLTNNGARACTVTALTDPDNNFAFVNRPNIPLTVAPGASEALQVRFSPPAGPVQAYASTFQVTSDEPGAGANITVNLVAQGGGTPLCDIRVTPEGNDLPLTMRDGRLQFGAVNIGYRQVQPIRIENVGNADCTLQSYTLTTEVPGQFTVASTPPAPRVIAAGTIASIDVTFAPTGPASNPFGVYGGLRNYVTFVVNGPGLTDTDREISLSARPTEPTIDVLPSDVNFGLVTWERPQAPDNRSSCGSVERQVNIYNSGTGNLVVRSVVIDPSSDPVFLVTQVRRGGQAVNPPTNITITPGQSIEVGLRFFPSRANPSQHQGLLVIDNDVTNPPGGMGGVPLTVPLRGEGTTNAQQTDVFSQLADNKIDILWVVDDSGSMSEEQNLLAQNFQSFIGFADSLGVDYQVGVTTTEVNDATSGVIWGCNNFPRIITPANANRVQAFQCAANVTSPPSGNQRPNPGGSDEQEAGLQAARIALDVPVINTQNAGFLRADARLAVIVVSDEEDQSDGSVSLYVDFFRNLKGFANPQLVSVSAIAGDVPGGCATAVEGRRYSDASNQLGGQFSSICSASWQQMLQNIGLGVFALRQAWTLSRPADPSTISVRVNGVSVPQNGTNGWTYDPATNTVTFRGTGIPAPGATIEVQYGSQCLP